MVESTRELILLRHAHAEPPLLGQADYDRPLSPTGLAEAEAAGVWLAGNGLIPDRILCSPARRTRETLEVVLARLGYAEVRRIPTIYDATPGTLAALVDEHRDVERLLLVGHNPGLEQLVALMGSGRSTGGRGMPPAGIAVLAYPATARLEPGSARLSRFWAP